MLYQLYEAQRSLMEPLTDFAQAASKLYSNDKSPLSHLPMAQRMAAGSPTASSTNGRPTSTQVNRPARRRTRV